MSRPQSLRPQLHKWHSDIIIFSIASLLGRPWTVCARTFSAAFFMCVISEEESCRFCPNSMRDSSLIRTSLGGWWIKSIPV